MRRAGSLRAAAMLMLPVLLVWNPCPAQTVPTNLDMLRTMMGETASEVRTRIAGAGNVRVSVRVVPEDVGWAVDEPVLRELSRPAGGADGSALQALLGVRDVRITYGDAEREGLFGPTTVLRSVRMTVSVRVTRGDSLLYAADLPREAADRIPEGAIASVEHPSLIITRGVREPEGLFRDVAEPLILIGAIGVSVFLLFHVRS